MTDNTITHGLRQIRRTIDGTQPIDTTGAVMAIDHLITTLAPKPSITGLSFDGFGINGSDQYKTRLATFDRARLDEAQHFGPLFAAAPDLLAASIKALVALAECDQSATHAGLKVCDAVAALRSAIASAEGRK